MKKMKTPDIIALILVFFLGSAFMFFAVNCFITIIFNYEAKFNFPYIFGILPHLVFAIELVTFLIFLCRYLSMEPQYRDHHVKVYMRQFLIYSLIGLILTILGGTIGYNFLIDNPYPGVLIVCLIMNIIIGGFALTCLIKLRRKEEKSQKLTYKAWYGWFTAAISLLIFFALFRFGAFLWSFFYMDYSKFLLTLPFYISLLVPVACLVLLELPRLGYKLEHFKRNQIIAWSIVLAIGLATSLYTIIVGIKNPELISLISAAMPIERIASKPLEIIVLVGVNTLIPLGKLLQIIIKKDKQ
ncbi:MAG: hypothetical protein MJ221_01550 [Bacilli bacterium]|nr:hypothetical protein [Bacilli bacterium]